MIATQANTDAVADRNPVVVLAADENFALPLAATIRSALDNLAADRKLLIYVMDAGMTDASRAQLLRSWPEGRFHIEWLAVDASRLTGLPISGHVNHVSYYRLLIPQILPVHLRRAIYLDADLIVRADLGRLWDGDFSGQLCLAAQDCASPYFDSFQTLANYQLCRPHMGTAYPVPNFRELGLKPEAAYFNAGVLLIDLVAWRAAGVSRQLLACLEEHRRHILFWDQYALNVVLAGQWGRLDLRWNQGAHVFHYPTWEHSPFDRSTYEQVRRDPYIVHFTTRSKPWRACRHPLRCEFFKYLDRTAWAGRRPPRLMSFLELMKSHERRLRRGRNWLRSRARRWLAGGAVDRVRPNAGQADGVKSTSTQ